MKYVGQIISEGIAYGKVGFLKTDKSVLINNDFDKNQIELLDNAVDYVTDILNQKIFESKTQLDERVSEIFETHKYIVNDPIVLKRTKELILKNNSASKAYNITISKILAKFTNIDNEYMLGRIIDIMDATDQVKVALKSITNNHLVDFQKSTILILKELKPSVIYSTNNSNVKGFISKTGFFHQHSGIIARKMEKAGIICNNIFEVVNDNDYVLIDCYKGEIYINPNEKIIKSLKEKYK